MSELTVKAPLSAKLNDIIEVSWTVSNLGDTEISGGGYGYDGWYDEIYISDDASLDYSDTRITSRFAREQLPLASEESYTITDDITISNRTTGGNRYLLFVTNYYRYSGEAANITTQSNANVTSDSITLESNANVTSDSITLESNANVTSDSITLESNANVTSDSITLESNANVTSDSITLESNANALSYQREVLKRNNVKAVPITIEAPDLVVSAATAPITAEERSTITLSWTVTNNSSEVAAGDWYDAVYLSDNTILEAREDRFLGFVPVEDQTPLAAGKSYTLTEELTLPTNTGAGTWYLLFVADATRKQGETRENNNVKVVKIDLTVPDLVITQASAPLAASVNEKIPVSWTVKNQGEVAAAADWSDRIYISDDTILDSSDTFVTSTWTGDRTPLAANNSYTIEYDTQQGITIPNTRGGNRYLLFVADSYYSNQSETNEDNNLYAVPIYIKASDLVVSATTAPSTANAGSPISLSWTVTNSGEAATWPYTGYGYYYSSWSDAVYFSHDQQLDYGTDIYITGASRSYWDQPLVPGGSYTVTQNPTLPNTDVGQGYLLFVTDVNNNQREANDNNNITAVPLTLNGQAADLVVSSATAPDTVTLGKYARLYWTVANAGNAATPSNYWYDSIYLSDDASFDSSKDTLITDAYAWYHKQSPLAATDSYTAQRDIVIPDSELGSRYLLFVADRFNNQRESDETNNVYAVQVEVKAADLLISDAKAPKTAIVNQTIPIQWSVTIAIPSQL